jgi:signal transduction histidine kinase
MRFVRLVLLLDVMAAALAGAAVLVGIGVPLAAAGRLGPGMVGVIAATAAAAVLTVGTVLLERSVARPVDRLLGAAERLGAADGSFPLLSPPGEWVTASLGRGAIAFERVAAELQEERGRLAAKIAELERANRELAEARESWIRSERLAALGRLASGIAHEVGNPLGAIAGFTEVARGRLGPGSGEVDDLLARIAVESARIDRLVRDMLDFARPAEPVCVPIALQAVVESALRLARVQPRFKEVEPVLDLPADLPPVVADEGRLAQVFLNLFLNAGDAMGGRGRVRVDAAGGEGGVRIQVADEGPGIPPQHLARVFDPFFTTKAPGSGTGLGLAVSHRLMEAMGGRIDARNAPAGGAVFELWLPVEGGKAPRGEGPGERARGSC